MSKPKYTLTKENLLNAIFAILLQVISTLIFTVLALIFNL